MLFHITKKLEILKMKQYNKEKIFEYCAFLLTFTVFLIFFIDSLSYGRTFDDDIF